MKIKLGFILFFCIFVVSISAQTAMADSIERVGACATPGTAWGVFIQGLYGFIADAAVSPAYRGSSNRSNLK